MIKNTKRIVNRKPIWDRYRYDVVVIVVLVILSLFLRIYRLDELMPFIGDQGLFYLPAWDMLTKGVIPLVGPETSHPWIHHGAIWTYVLAFILWIFNFNPVPPAYFIALLGVATVWLLYKLSSVLFSKRIALIVALLYATSPLVVLNSRMPYHTSPIPFFTILLVYSVYKWMKGNAYFFPLTTFLIGLLYNHEITTFVLVIPIIIILLYGLFKKEIWAKILINKKIITYSFLSFLIPMTPFILHDINNGYKQTVGFVVWVLYRIVKFPLNIVNSSDLSKSAPQFQLSDFFTNITQLIFATNLQISIIIFVFSLVYLFYSIYKKVKDKRLNRGYILLFLYVVVPTTGLFLHRVPIEADILLISPFLIMMIAVFLNQLFSLKLIKFAAFAILGIIVISNLYHLLSTEYLTKIGNASRITFKERKTAVDSVIKISRGRQYNLVGKGELSDFPMFTVNYEYLLLWKGHPPAKKGIDLKIVVWEKNGEVIVYEEK